MCSICIYKNRWSIPVMFTSSVMCKSLNFVTRVTCVESLTILLIISIQRYKKICTRGKSRMSLFWKRMAIVISMICSTVLSIPSLVFIGVNETKRNIYNNVTEFRCEHVTRNVHEKYGLNIYLGFIGLFFVGIDQKSVQITWSKIRVEFAPSVPVWKWKWSKQHRLSLSFWYQLPSVPIVPPVLFDMGCTNVPNLNLQHVLPYMDNPSCGKLRCLIAE